MSDIKYKKSNNNIDCVYYKDCARSYPVHTHTSHIMLGSVEKGRVAVIQNGVKEIIGEGEQFSILPNIPHEIYPDSDSYSMVVMCIKSEETLCEEYLGDLFETIISQPENAYLIEEMADSAHMSKFHMIRLFKKAFGLTPHQFQIQCKVRKAQKILEEKKDIGEAAFEAGFYDESHMDRCFQKIVGLTPKQYLNAIE